MSLRVAVLIPCYNEEAAIAQTVKDFRAALPMATVYVYDNNSTDQTIARATEAGAVVRKEPRQGKGNVVRRMFADIEADIYVMIDGDDTYDATVAPAFVQQMIDGGYDIISGRRIATAKDAYRAGHVLGNKLLTGLTALMFNVHLLDMLTGYRVMSRRFAKSFPFTSEGFGIETEITVHAVRLLMPMIEIDTKYKERPAGSTSKLSTYKDGFKILFTIVSLVREERPLIFFTGLFAILALISLAIGVPVVDEFVHTGYVTLLPRAVLAAAMMTLAFLSLFSGLILDTVTRGRWEMKRMGYLSIEGPQGLTKKMSLIARLEKSQFLHFAIVGGTGFFVNEAVLFVFIKLLHLNAYVAGVLAFLVTVTYTWMGNRLLTFRGEAAIGARGMAVEWVKFVGANLLGFVANYSVYSALVMFARAPLNSPYLALACGTLVGLLFNFTLSKRLVFRDTHPLS